MREDGAFVEAGENDNLIIQKISSNPAALGIFGFSFLEENRDRVRGLAIDGFLARPSKPSPTARIRFRARFSFMSISTK